MHQIFNIGQKKKFKWRTKKGYFDEAIQSVFQVLRHWFQYKVPKWIGVINTLQEYVCSSKGKKLEIILIMQVL